MLVKAMEGMPMSASEDDALEAFDRQVRRDVPNAFCGALGRFTFQYKHYIVFGLFGVVARRFEGRPPAGVRTA